VNKLDNTIDNLRDILFSTIRRLGQADLKNLKDEVMRANAIANAAQVIVNSATVECQFMALTKSKGTGFIPIGESAHDDDDEKPVRGTLTKMSHL